MNELCHGGCGRRLFKDVNWTENNRLKVEKRMLCNECRKDADLKSPLKQSKAKLWKQVKELQNSLRIVGEQKDHCYALNVKLSAENMLLRGHLGEEKVKEILEDVKMFEISSLQRGL